MYIAICEDNLQEREALSAAVERYALQRSLPLRWRAFPSPEEMLATARAEGFTHYFLDIMMPGMSGIDAAHEIRGFDTDAKIVFLTSFTEYAYQSYRVHAFDYLLKPVEEGKLFDVIDRFRQQEDRQDCFCLQNGRSIFRIPYAQLSHLEVNQKQLYFHLTNGQVRQLPGTMAEFERELLAHSEFIKIHRSYIVNLRQISVLSPDGCIMFSGKNLPVSRLLYNQVRREYMAQLFGSTEE